MDVPTIRRFRKNIRHVERELNLYHSSSCFQGITLAQCDALLELFSRDNISLSELSERLCLDKSTVSRTIEGLAEKDLVNRIVPKENRRKVILSLTREGIHICKGIQEDNETYLSTVLGSIPPEDLPVFLKAFEKVTGKIIQHNREKKKQCQLTWKTSKRTKS